MITRRSRFHGHNAVRTVYKNGQTVRQPELSLKYMPRQNGRGYRVAVVVSRKVHKSAVTRNRIRRRIYEIVRPWAAEFTGSYDLVFTVYSEQLAETDPISLAALVKGELEKAGVLSR